MVIYCITNKLCGMKYIGQTIKDPKIRWRQHCSKNSKSYISNSIKKHGKENFTFEVIDTANSLKELNEKETYWIKNMNTVYPFGYNLNYGGDNKIPSEETRKKLSKEVRHREKCVRFNKQHDAFFVETNINSNRMFHGLYETELDAKKAYDLAIILYCDGDAFLHFPDDIDYNAFSKKRKREIKDCDREKMDIAIRKKNNKCNNSSSIYKGVYYDKARSKWMAGLYTNGKTIFRKRFDTEIEAAIAYNAACVKHITGEYYLNEVSFDDVLAYTEKYGVL